jgi:integrase
MSKRRNDGVTIRRRPSGKYQYRVWDPNAGRYESATFARTAADKDRTKPGTAAGDDWSAKQLARYRLGQATAEPTAVEAVVDGYLADLRARRRKGKPLNPTHVRDVERTLVSLGVACPGLDLNKPNVAARTIRAWWDGLTATPTAKSGKVLRRNLKLAPRTKARYWVHVTSMLGWAVDRQVILRNPLAAERIDLEGDTEPVVFTLAQVRAVVELDAVDDPVWRWVLLMLGAGLRRSEALALKWEDMLWTQRLVRVVRGKGGGGRHTAPPPDLLAMLSRIGGPDATKSLVGPIVGDLAGGDRKGEWKAFRALLLRAGVDPDLGRGELSGRPVRLHPHSCRHTFAAMMLASGVDSLLLQQYLGHRDEGMTGHYSKLAALFTAEAQAEGWKPGAVPLLSPTSSAKRKVAT